MHHEELYLESRQTNLIIPTLVNDERAIVTLQDSLARVDILGFCHTLHLGCEMCIECCFLSIL